MRRILSLRLTVKSEPQQMPYAALVHGEVSFRTPVANAGDVYLADSHVSADSATTRYPIPAGSAERMKVTNLDKLWYHGTSGDFLYIIAEIEQ